MFKNVFIVYCLLLSTLLFSASEYDKDIVVKNQTRNDKVAAVFKEMMKNYEEENLEGFFSYVSEDRFQQDYMTFFDAIDEDMRVYDVLSVDVWINKTTEDGVKRFLNVKWEKRYESSKPVGLNSYDLESSSEYEVFQSGTTDFLFDEINGKYKLIQIAGNNFWGRSLKEWTEEVGDIAGQSSKEIVGDNVNGVYSGGTTPVVLPDLTFENIICAGGVSGMLTFDIVNLGGITSNGSVEYHVKENGMYGPILFYNSNIPGSDRVTLNVAVDCGLYNDIQVDPNDLINESDESNNIGF